MREIKFRAFDGDKKEMILPEYAEREDFHILADGQIVETHEYGYERHELTSKRPNSWVLMQHTGLKDKNGKDIYEGDIVNQEKWISVGVYKQTIGIVKYACCKFYSDCIEEWEGSHAELNGNAEVVGNIYENPNLLTK